MTMIEQMARAVCSAFFEDAMIDPSEFQIVWDTHKDRFMRQAHAVLETIRTPNDAMRLAPMGLDPTGTDVWQAMIDAILNEKEPPP